MSKKTKSDVDEPEKQSGFPWEWKPGHYHLGKPGSNIYRCGFSVEHDGTLEMAPSTADPFNDVIARQRGLNFYIDTLNDYIVKEHAAIERARKHCWDSIFKDLDIPRGTEGVTLQHIDGRRFKGIFAPPKPPEPETPKDPK